MKERTFKRGISLLTAFMMLLFTCHFTIKKDMIAKAEGNAETLVNIAMGELNAGEYGDNNKYTKWYGTETAWCHIFVSWCANQAGVSDIIPYTASCSKGIDVFKEWGRWEDSFSRGGSYIPQTGDIIYYTWNGGQSIDHVGIVNYVEGNKVHSIEGNWGDKVDTVEHYLSEACIVGYGIPCYKEIKGMNLGDEFFAVLGRSDTWSILGNVNGNVEVVKETGGAYNVWHFKRYKDNSYVIYSCLDNRVIDAHNEKEQSNVDVQDFNDSESQHWHIYNLGNGIVYIQPKNTGNVLDVAANPPQIGTNLILNQYNGTNAQHFTIYQVDRAKAGNLSVYSGDTINGTTFSWDNGVACNLYNLRIEKGTPGNTSTYLDKWNLTDTKCTLKLPEGYYEAYVDFCNGYSATMGNKISFYVTQPIAGVSNISVSQGNSSLPTKFVWTEAENAEVYNLRISTVQDNTTKSFLDVWNLTDLYYETVLPIGSYEVFVNACNMENYSTSNRIRFDITESIVPEKAEVSIKTLGAKCDFSWSKCKYADSYSLDIYSYDKKIINTVDIVNGNNYFINLPEGLYIATITAKNAVSNNVSISEETYFEVITDSTTSTTTTISTTTTTTTQKSTTTTQKLTTTTTILATTTQETTTTTTTSTTTTQKPTTTTTTSTTTTQSAKPTTTTTTSATTTQKPTTTTTTSTTTTQSAKPTTTTTTSATTTQKPSTTTVTSTTTSLITTTTLEKTEITLKNGEQYTIPIKLDNITFKSTNTDVAVVSPKGIVTAVGLGDAIINIIDKDYNVIQLKISVKSEDINPTDYILGDINNDGHINAVDASTVLTYYALISTNKDGGFSSTQKISADVNNDGLINAVDASCILSYYAYVSTTKENIKSLEEFLKK